MDLSTIITPELKALREAFVARGFDLRLVGGVVRDMVRGVQPKDIDLCTDADPIEQVSIYKNAGFFYFETGIAHGTISVRAGSEIYEITSLRTESNHDGRHATVAYTRDWLEDLSRRDLTFNAMALTFDGQLIDPFNGVQDLKNKVVRFVGNPDDRMREDYLRILRWLRFHGRIAPTAPLDAETVEAAQRQAEGLRGISRERVWMEMSKIISGEGAVGLIDSIYDLGLAGPIGLPIPGSGSLDDLRTTIDCTRNPVSLMFALLGGEHMAKLASDWKWSADERNLALFLNKWTFSVSLDEDFLRLMAYHDAPRAWVVELSRIISGPATAERLETVEVPVFPVKGQDLLDMGMKPGPEVGLTLKGMKVRWMESDYKMDKAALLRDF
jgi:tRNA nucleotidyltransferase/poly(A) polymerase